jgi:GxxExxY protein
MMRLPTPLDEETERQIEAIIGCAVRVHRELGPGFFESAYRNALCLELQSSDISFELEKPVAVKYRGTPVALHRVDLVVCERVIVELKSVAALEPIHGAQVLAYLKATGLRVGLLMNFGAPTLRAGLRRIVL